MLFTPDPSHLNSSRLTRESFREHGSPLGRLLAATASAAFTSSATAACAAAASCAAAAILRAMLFELPEVLLVEILTLAGLQSAGRVLSSKKLERCHASSLDDLLWSTLVLKRWAIAALPATGNWSWRSFATFLETEVRGLLRRSVKLAVTKLRDCLLYTSPSPRDS